MMNDQRIEYIARDRILNLLRRPEQAHVPIGYSSRASARVGNARTAEGSCIRIARLRLGLGKTIEGTQAEFVQIPHANASRCTILRTLGTSGEYDIQSIS